MNDNELKKLQDEVLDIPRGKERTKKQMYVSCIEMVNSILAYNNYVKRNMSAKDVLVEDLHSYHSYLKDYVKEFGNDKVVSIIQEQMSSIKDVVFAGYDSEGVSYNSIIWKE